MSAVKFRLVMTRHGQTDSNKDKILQGQLDTRLNDVGRSQAECLGAAISDEEFDAVYSSDLQRAHETCSIALRSSSSSNHQTIIRDELLRERCYGKYEGRPTHEFVDRDEPGDGETYRDVLNRAETFFRRLCEDMGRKRKRSAFVVSHGCFLNVLFQHLSDEFDVRYNGRKLKERLHNTSLTVFNITLTPQSASQTSAVSIECLAYNNVAHIK